MSEPSPSAFQSSASPAANGLAETLAALMSHSRWLSLGGALLLLAMLPTFALSLLHPQQFNGIDAYDKPLKFQLSLAVYLLSLAWMRGHLTPAGRARRVAVLTDVVPTLAAFGEAAYILWRASRGEASHFNVASPLASALYGLMGVGALLLVAASGVLAWLLRRHAQAGLNAAYLASVRHGLWLTMILGGLVGAYLSSQTGHAVGGTLGGAPGGIPNDSFGLPLAGWSRVAGDLRVPHFFGIHAMQLLPLFGWALTRNKRRAAPNVSHPHGGRTTCVVGLGALSRRWPEPAATTAVHAAAIAYAAFTVLTFVQAAAGVPFLFGL